jgi:NADPH-dependent 2,4-dienoyl-CoA reductase/sulfur reductase-like enzyme
MISEEKEAPYDRTMLTKNMKAEPEGIRLRSEDFFKSAGITFMKGTTVTKIEAAKKAVVLENGKELAYDKLCIATGSTPVKNAQHFPGATLKNVNTLRNYVDLNNIRNSIKSGTKNILVAGGSFIGMEAACSIKSEFKDAVNVTVVVSENEPYTKTLGPEIGSHLRALAEKSGVKFALKTRVKSIQGSSSVREVELSDGSKVPADLVLLGTGVSPNSEIASGIVQLDKDGGIPGSAFLQVGGSGDIYCAGDVCSFPYYLSGQRIRVEHYVEAMSQGVTAAWNMLGKMVPYATVPFFWTRVCNNGVRYSGWAPTWDKIHFDGTVESGEFLAYYIKDNKILAVADMNRGNDMIMLNQALKMGLMPSGSDLISGKVTIDQIKKTVQDNKKGCKCQRKTISEAPVQI